MDIPIIIIFAYLLHKQVKRKGLNPAAWIGRFLLTWGMSAMFFYSIIWSKYGFTFVKEYAFSLILPLSLMMDICIWGYFRAVLSRKPDIEELEKLLNDEEGGSDNDKEKDLSYFR